MAQEGDDRLDRRQFLRVIVAGAVSLGAVAAASAEVKDETYASNEDADGARNGSTEGRTPGSEASVPTASGDE